MDHIDLRAPPGRMSQLPDLPVFIKGNIDLTC